MSLKHENIFACYVEEDDLNDLDIAWMSEQELCLHQHNSEKSSLHSEGYHFK